MPVRGGQQSTRIETLPGGTYTGDIDDVKYLREKLFAALKVPQAYLAMGEGAAEDKATTEQQAKAEEAAKAAAAAGTSKTPPASNPPAEEPAATPSN